MGFSFVFPFLPLYIKNLHSTTHLNSEMASGLVFSIQALTMALTAPVWGAVADRYGRKLMVIRAMVGGGITIFLMGMVRTAEELIILRAIQGVLSGVISANMALVASIAPRNKTGYAIGILQMGMWTGVSVGPLAGGIFADLFGFRMPFYVSGIMLCASGMIVWWLVEEHFVHPAQKPGRRFSFISDWKNILTRRSLFFTLMLRFIVSFSVNILAPVLPLFLHQIAYKNAPVSTYTGIMAGLSSLAAIFSGVYLGRLGDRIGHIKIVIFSTCTTALFFFPQGLVTAIWQLIILQTLTGFFSGGLTPSLSAMLAQNSKSNEVGSVYGIDNSITSAGRALAPMVGALFAIWFGFRGVFFSTGAMFIIMTILTLFLMSNGAIKTRMSAEQAPETVESKTAEAAIMKEED